MKDSLRATPPTLPIFSLRSTFEYHTEAGLSQEKLVEKLQLAGWNIDRSLLVLIEKEQRVLLDYD